MQQSFFRSTNFLAFFACLLWSSAFVGIKIGLEHHSPLQFAGFRFTLSGIFLALFYGKPTLYIRQVKKEWRFVLRIMLVQTVLQYSLFYTGINMLPASISAMIIGASPLFAAILAHFLMGNDKLSRHKLTCLALGIVGVIIISMSKDSSDTTKTVSILGIIILLLNNLVAGYYNIMVAKGSKSISSIVLSSVTLFGGGLSLVLISIPFEGQSLHNVNFEYMASLLWLSILSAIAFGIWYSLLRRPNIKVSELNIWKFFIPVGGAILAWTLIPTEHPQLPSVIGMVFIGGSLLLLNRKKNKAKKEA